MPLSGALIEALTSYEVSFVLLPLQSKKDSPAKDEKKDKKERGDKVLKVLKKGGGKGKTKRKDTPRHLEARRSFEDAGGREPMFLLNFSRHTHDMCIAV